MAFRLSVLCLSVLALSACHRPEPAAPESLASEAAPASVADLAAVSTSISADGSPLSCSSEIGANAAQKRADVCRSVSPATHPPCNVANSCAMIEDEIARSCALFGGQGTLMDGCEIAPKSQEAAVAVVTRYYSALNARDYDTAWQQWGESGPPNQTRAAFEAGFARTRSTHVTIGKLEEPEGGAGSIYQTVPVVIDSTLEDGTHQRFTGEYIVRRVNDVDGATAAQLRWHLSTAKLTAAR